MVGEEEEIDVVSFPTTSSSCPNSDNSHEEGALVIAEHPGSPATSPESSETQDGEDQHSSPSPTRVPSPREQDQTSPLPLPATLNITAGVSSISKLESVVNNLVKSKTDALSLPVQEDATPCPEKLVAKATTQALAERRKSTKPRKAVKAIADVMPLPTDGSLPTSDTLPTGLPTPKLPPGMMFPGITSPLMPFG